jgi:hypothetical protein
MKTLDNIIKEEPKKEKEVLSKFRQLIWYSYILSPIILVGLCYLFDAIPKVLLGYWVLIMFSALAVVGIEKYIISVVRKEVKYKMNGKLRWLSIVILGVVPAIMLVLQCTIFVHLFRIVFIWLLIEWIVFLGIGFMVFGNWALKDVKKVSTNNVKAELK